LTQNLILGLDIGTSSVRAALYDTWGNLLPSTLVKNERALIATEIIVGTSGIGFLMFDARRAGSVVEILLGMIILGILWYIVDSWILAPIERATGQRWGLVTR